MVLVINFIVSLIGHGKQHEYKEYQFYPKCNGELWVWEIRQTSNGKVVWPIEWGNVIPIRSYSDYSTELIKFLTVGYWSSLLLFYFCLFLSILLVIHIFRCISSWLIDPFIIIWWPFLPLVTGFESKSVFFDVTVSALFWFLIAWNILFHPIPGTCMCPWSWSVSCR